MKDDKKTTLAGFLKVLNDVETSALALALSVIAAAKSATIASEAKKCK